MEHLSHRLLIVVIIMLLLLGSQIGVIYQIDYITKQVDQLVDETCARPY